MTPENREKHAAQMRLKNRSSELNELAGKLAIAKKYRDSNRLAMINEQIADYWDRVKADLEIVNGKAFTESPKGNEAPE